MKKLVLVSLVVLVSVFTNMVSAGVPLNNIEGVGGIAFNPLAYTAGTAGDANFLGENVSKPQIGLWHINLHEPGIDWTTFGIAETFFKRVELSYGHESLDFANSKSINKDNFGAKVLLLPEGDILPAISIGGVFKSTTQNLVPDVKNSGADYYLVGTKLVKALPWPVLLSGGVLSTKGQVLGVLGFNDSRKEVLFGNIDVIPLSNAAVGFEYRQGAHYDDWKDANYWDAHVAWFVNPNLTLVAAYANTGNQESTKAFGLGDGLVLSAQYQF